MCSGSCPSFSITTRGQFPPDVIISHRMTLADAAKRYKVLNDHTDERRNVVMKL